MILDKTYDLLKTRYYDLIRDLTIADARIGVFLTAVILSDGSCGTASTVTDPNSNCAKADRDFGAFTPGKINGRKVIDLLESHKDLNLLISLKLAVLNAISSNIIQSADYRIIENTDPIELVDLSPHKTITIVGAFQSYIRKISGSGNKLYVLEMDANTLTGDQKQFYVPAKEYSKVLPKSDVVIITGLTLVNNTIDELLAAIPSHARVIVTGPSSNLIPDVLFENNVNIIGATRITNPGLLMDVVSEAGAGYHLFQYCAQKICIVNEK
jgi:uncharacterized protein